MVGQPPKRSRPQSRNRRPGTQRRTRVDKRLLRGGGRSRRLLAPCRGPRRRRRRRPRARDGPIVGEVAELEERLELEATGLGRGQVRREQVVMLHEDKIDSASPLRWRHHRCRSMGRVEQPARDQHLMVDRSPGTPSCSRKRAKAITQSRSERIAACLWPITSPFPMKARGSKGQATDTTRGRGGRRLDRALSRGSLRSPSRAMY